MPFNCKVASLIWPTLHLFMRLRCCLSF